MLTMIASFAAPLVLGFLRRRVAPDRAEAIISSPWFGAGALAVFAVVVGVASWGALNLYAWHITSQAETACVERHQVRVLNAKIAALEMAGRQKDYQLRMRAAATAALDASIGVLETKKKEFRDDAPDPHEQVFSADDSWLTGGRMRPGSKGSGVDSHRR